MEPGVPFLSGGFKLPVTAAQTRRHLRHSTCPVTPWPLPAPPVIPETGSYRWSVTTKPVGRRRWEPAVTVTRTVELNWSKPSRSWSTSSVTTRSTTAKTRSSFHRRLLRKKNPVPVSYCCFYVLSFADLFYYHSQFILHLPPNWFLKLLFVLYNCFSNPRTKDQDIYMYTENIIFPANACDVRWRMWKVQYYYLIHLFSSTGNSFLQLPAAIGRRLSQARLSLASIGRSSTGGGSSVSGGEGATGARSREPRASLCFLPVARAVSDPNCVVQPGSGQGEGGGTHLESFYCRSDFGLNCLIHS